ncbi:hypothetical protein [Tsukamurella sp. 1534]|uniref:hypothetical protein n=1 Tax=Tsukamurella sp. 1534 TaxID=1151061 RepID=UPI0002FD7B2E|nr:hypothetical protein [Tsukamurella sp. 1534]
MTTRTSMKARSALIALAAVPGLALAGCSGDDATPAPSSAPNSGVTGQAPSGENGGAGAGHGMTGEQGHPGGHGGTGGQKQTPGHTTAAPKPHATAPKATPGATQPRQPDAGDDIPEPAQGQPTFTGPGGDGDVPEPAQGQPTFSGPGNDDIPEPAGG